MPVRQANAGGRPVVELREPIDIAAGGMDLIVKMSEGNPGALRVLMELLPIDPILVLHLDDMNIRGWQVWVGYKDHCNYDLSLFTKCIQDRDQKMIETINGQRGPDGPLAVISGASYPGGRI